MSNNSNVRAIPLQEIIQAHLRCTNTAESTALRRILEWARTTHVRTDLLLPEHLTALRNNGVRIRHVEPRITINVV